MDFAERLGLWLNAFDAIHLQAAHQSIRAIGAAAPARTALARRPRADDLAQDLERARGTLAAAIAQDPVALAVPEHPRLRAKAGEAPAADPGYAPWQQRHLELQRQMELLVGPLREHVRQALGRASPRLRQLAALDAALEPVLARHEQSLLPTLPKLLKRRFDQLRRQAGAPPADAGAAPHGFAADWRQALLAELELRLQPVAGLIEALRNEPNHPR